MATREGLPEFIAKKANETKKGIIIAAAAAMTFLPTTEVIAQDTGKVEKKTGLKTDAPAIWPDSIIKSTPKSNFVLLDLLIYDSNLSLLFGSSFSIR